MRANDSVWLSGRLPFGSEPTGRRLSSELLDDSHLSGFQGTYDRRSVTNVQHAINMITDGRVTFQEHIWDQMLDGMRSNEGAV